MDDLAGLDWSSSKTAVSAASNNATQPASSSFYPALRPTPSPSISGRSTPLSGLATNTAAQGVRSTSRPPTKPSTPANDSFSNLVSFNSTKPANNMSLQERQRQLQEEKSRQEAEKKKASDGQFGIQETQFWDTLGTGRSTTVSRGPSPVGLPHSGNGDTDDILSAFSANAPVNKSSNYPPPPASVSGNNTPGVAQSQSGPAAAGLAKPTLSLDDDDPFDLAAIAPRPTQPGTKTTDAEDEDDVLGLLGKPVSELPPPKAKEPARAPETSHQSSREKDQEPDDKSVAELVDMGFPIDKARQALAQTSSGTDVQAAVGWLLTEAHRATNSTKKGGAPNGDGNNPSRSIRRDTGEGSRPAWMAQAERSTSVQRREDNRSPSNGEKDIGKYASDVGSTLFKSANSLWKTGRQRVQKVVTELQTESDPNQPKWMRDAQLGEASKGASERPQANPVRRESEPPKDAASAKDPPITDEALLLESGGARPPRKQAQNREAEVRPSRPTTNSLDDPRSGSSDRAPNRSEHMERAAREERLQRQDVPSRGRLTKQAVEEQSSQAYVSPARRKKVTPNRGTADSDSWSLSSHGGADVSGDRSTLAAQAANNTFRQPTPNSQPSAPRSTKPTPPRPRVQTRVIPALSSHGLATSTSHRQKGTEAFKRGDYSTAHTCYTSALGPLPNGHPIMIIVLCNRALTNLKVGDPKAAVSDAETALTTIGPSRGDGEKISLGGAEGEKEMKEFFGKALMRKAEALEQMEKWGEAAKVWSEAVGANVGGATSIQGRNRSQKAAGGGQKPQAAPARRPTPAKRAPPPKPSALQDLTGRPARPTASSAEAVTRLRKANEEAERADDEKFALSDSVDAKLTAWKGGKQDNLRALLGSLDTVLWPEAGWKKVGMHELVLANKVKVVYMKGIAKVHPDKLSTTATTEQRMISGAVFSTLNEAWDKFKKENGL